jgi:hypothetical protein
MGPGSTPSNAITPAGSTGAKTINNKTGCVRLAAAASSLVVTNSFVTTNSVIQLTLAANDATCLYVNYTPGNGSFTINAPVAPTAELRIDFAVD